MQGMAPIRGPHPHHTSGWSMRMFDNNRNMRGEGHSAHRDRGGEVARLPSRTTEVDHVQKVEEGRQTAKYSEASTNISYCYIALTRSRTCRGCRQAAQSSPFDTDMQEASKSSTIGPGPA